MSETQLAKHAYMLIVEMQDAAYNFAKHTYTCITSKYAD